MARHLHNFGFTRTAAALNKGTQKRGVDDGAIVRGPTVSIPVWGMTVEKPSSVAFVFSTIQGKTKARDVDILAPRLYNRYNHAHVPGPHMWQSPGPGPGSKCSKTVEVGCSYSELKPCQREIDTDEIQEKKL